MSHYHLKCITCNVETDSWNHADDDIKDALRSLSHLKALADTNAWDLSDLRTQRTYSCHGLATWLLEHYEHALEIWDEYGQKQSISDLTDLMHYPIVTVMENRFDRFPYIPTREELFEFSITEKYLYPMVRSKWLPTTNNVIQLKETILELKNGLP